MHISKNNLNPSLKKTIIKEFVQTLEDLKGVEEKQNFIQNFFTEEEIETYAKRLAVFYWLKKKRSHENIMQNLHVSLADIKKIEKLIDTKGIKLALKKMEAEEWANRWSEKIKKLV